MRLKSTPDPIHLVHKSGSRRQVTMRGVIWLSWFESLPGRICPGGRDGRDTQGGFLGPCGRRRRNRCTDIVGKDRSVLHGTACQSRACPGWGKAGWAPCSDWHRRGPAQLDRPLVAWNHDGDSARAPGCHTSQLSGSFTPSLPSGMGQRRSALRRVAHRPSPMEMERQGAHH